MRSPGLCSASIALKLSCSPASPSIVIGALKIPVGVHPGGAPATCGSFEPYFHLSANKTAPFVVNNISLPMTPTGWVRRLSTAVFVVEKELLDSFNFHFPKLVGDEQSTQRGCAEIAGKVT